MALGDNQGMAGGDREGLWAGQTAPLATWDILWELLVHAIPFGSVQALLLQKPGHQVGDFEIVKIREWKVRVATNAYFGQMH